MNSNIRKAIQLFKVSVFVLVVDGGKWLELELQSLILIHLVYLRRCLPKYLQLLPYYWYLGHQSYAEYLGMLVVCFIIKGHLRSSIGLVPNPGVIVLGSLITANNEMPQLFPAGDPAWPGRPENRRVWWQQQADWPENPSFGWPPSRLPTHLPKKWGEQTIITANNFLQYCS